MNHDTGTEADGGTARQLHHGETVGQSDTSKPLLLLDVDGVLNAFPDRAGFEYARHVIDGYRIHLHPEVREMVSALEEAFEVVWFTLWNHRATPGLGPHVGLDHAAHLTTSWERGWDAALMAGYPERSIGNLMYAKTPLLPELVGTERPWVWIDDAHSGWDHEYLVRVGFDPRRFRLVRTDPEVGLVWADVERAVEFARVITTDAEAVADDAATVPPTAAGPHHPGSTLGRVDAVSDEALESEAEELAAEFE